MKRVCAGYLVPFFFSCFVFISDICRLLFFVASNVQLNCCVQLRPREREGGSTRASHDEMALLGRENVL